MPEVSTESQTLQSVQELDSDSTSDLKSVLSSIKTINSKTSAFEEISPKVDFKTSKELQNESIDALEASAKQLNAVEQTYGDGLEETPITQLVTEPKQHHDPVKKILKAMKKINKAEDTSAEDAKIAKLKAEIAETKKKAKQLEDEQVADEEKESTSQQAPLSLATFGDSAELTNQAALDMAQADIETQKLEDLKK